MHPFLKPFQLKLGIKTTITSLNHLSSYYNVVIFKMYWISLNDCIRFTNRSSVVPHLGQTTPGEAPDTPGSQVDLRGPRGLNSNRVLLVVPGLEVKAVAAAAATTAHGAKAVLEDPALGATTKTNNSNLANSSRIRASTKQGKSEYHFDIFVILTLLSSSKSM